MGTNDGWTKQAERLRELSRDPAVRSYLLGRLVAGSSAEELADLVEACLVYRERFGAAGNDRRPATTSLVSGTRINRDVQQGVHDTLYGGMDTLPDL